MSRYLLAWRREGCRGAARLRKMACPLAFSTEFPPLGGPQHLAPDGLESLALQLCWGQSSVRSPQAKSRRRLGYRGCSAKGHSEATALQEKAEGGREREREEEEK